MFSRLIGTLGSRCESWKHVPQKGALKEAEEQRTRRGLIRNLSLTLTPSTGVHVDITLHVRDMNHAENQLHMKKAKARYSGAFFHFV